MHLVESKLAPYLYVSALLALDVRQVPRKTGPTREAVLTGDNELRVG
ncbi:MAG: hypothetical protein NUW01_08175 [Gemmatimonadaceae bacterium]|nr:hypothetical protein [Gemmatimonadaceae bacterium]